MAPFIRLHEDGSGNQVCEDGIFGLLPHFQVEMAAGRKTYNARTETVATLPSFRESWKKGWRCIIPSEWIYEPNWETGKAVRWRIALPMAPRWASQASTAPGPTPTVTGCIPSPC
jgi:putative SOS response-associated peptidase YedK